MHIKIKTETSQIIAPINDITLHCSPRNYNSEDCYVAYIKYQQPWRVEISKDEYERIEKLLALNNKTELKDFVKPHKINNVIQELQVNEY